MHAKRPTRHVAVLVAVLTLLLATPALAAPGVGGGASWAGFPELGILWTRVVDAFGPWFGAHGAGANPNGLTAAPHSWREGSTSMDRVTGASGQFVDPNGTPEATGSWAGVAPAGFASGSTASDVDG